MSTTRPYIVIDNTGNTRLVQATNQAQALRHVAMDLLSVHAASATEVIELMQSGVTPEAAGADVSAPEKNHQG